MQGPLQIRFHGFDPSSVLSQLIEDKVNLLEKRFNHITDCSVAFQRLHHRHHQGNILKVTIELRIPGQKLIVSHERSESLDHDDPYIVLRDAFDAVQRKLSEHAQKMRGDVKAHQNPYQLGKVLRIFPQDGYGFIVTSDEREVYFHENSVLNDQFVNLEVNSRVRFVEEMGEKGVQASTVQVVKI